jgi:hypothetical protein
MSIIRDPFETDAEYQKRVHLRGFYHGVIFTAITTLLVLLCSVAARADGVYVTADVSAADRGEQRVSSMKETYNADAYCQYRICSSVLLADIERDDSASNPYVKIALGYDWQVTDWLTWTVLEVSHESSIATGQDKGFNKITSGIRIDLWRRK